MAKAEPITMTVELSGETKAALAAARQAVADGIEAPAVEAALRSVISDLDYDIHKQIECDEETGESTYPDVAADFIRAYKAAAAAK